MRGRTRELQFPRVNISEAGEMAQRVTSSHCESKGWSVEPQHLCHVGMEPTLNPAEEGEVVAWGWEGTVRNKLATPAKSVSSGLK